MPPGALRQTRSVPAGRTAFRGSPLRGEHAPGSAVLTIKSRSTTSPGHASAIAGRESQDHVLSYITQRPTSPSQPTRKWRGAYA
jgi:hypothetical protein